MKPNSFWKNCFQGKSQSYLKNMISFRKMLNFSSGENALSPIYSVGEPRCDDIKTALAKAFNVFPNMVTVGNGSDEIIENIPRIFLEPGEGFFAIIPTFFRFIESSQRMKGKLFTVATKKSHGFKFTGDVIEEAIKVIKEKDPKIIWLCSPNNPTGKTMTLDQIERIAKETNNLVVVDEAFQEFVDLDGIKKSSIQLLKNNNNILVLKTFSKSWGLGGIRFGFAIGSPMVIESLEKWRLPFNINTITKEIILKLLVKQKQLICIVRKTKINRCKLFSQINKLDNFEIGANSKTNVFMLRHKYKNIFEELLKRNILTANLQNVFGLEGMNFVRITVKTREENELLISALKEIDNCSH